MILDGFGISERDSEDPDRYHISQYIYVECGHRVWKEKILGKMSEKALK